ncbi:CAP domain-containing protein [Pedobacter agri]|uniref:CAP domain-containing protein n=2 Tax=Pedobacter TaxID=84567 RepID=A0A9X3I9U9_9SPHI|nr:CAP domain-containing protein [Pedobacter agri]MCX3266247.1 CAP domain-containing protein [Pedobacter agri]
MKLYVPMIGLAIACFATSCKKGTESTAIETLTKIETPLVTNLNNELMLKLVNDIRLAGCKCGTTTMPPVTALTWNSNLATAASNQSKYMESINKMQHESANGKGVGDRVTASGYQWKSVGENVAQGQTTENQVFNDWLKSEGHCKNMMNADYKEIGAARAGAFWTQVFAVKM